MQGLTHRRHAMWGGLVAIVAAVLCLGLVATAPAAKPPKDDKPAKAGKPGHAGKPDCAGRGVPVNKISIQEWTFAEYIGFGTDAATQARLEEVLAFLSETGYRNIELFTLSGLTAEQMRALLDEYGLKATSRHVDVGTPANPLRLRPDPRGQPHARHQVLWLGRHAQLRDRGGVGGLRRVPQRARRAGPQGRSDAHGPQPQLGVRAHVRRHVGVRDPAREHRAQERRLPGRPVLGRARPRRLRGRHEHRCGRRPRGRAAHPAAQARPALPREGHGDRHLPGPDRIVGEGGIDFPSLFDATQGPVRYYVVEHDPRFGDPTFDPFEAAATGFEYLRCVRF